MSRNFHKEKASMLALGSRVTGLVALVLAVQSPTQAIEVRAFADIGFETSDETDATNQFVLGGLDLFASQDIDDRTDVFFEYVVENDGEQFVIDLERLWIKREINPFISFSAGRIHSPLGYWNRSFHHGILIQDTVSRPSFLEFEDGEGAILPMHLIGVEGSGGFRLGGVEFTYELAVGNTYTFNTDASLNAAPAGDGLEIGLQNVSDLSNDKTFVTRLTVGHESFPLEIGIISMVTSYVEAGDGNPAFGSIARGKSLVDQTVFGFELHFSTDNLNILGEAFNISNTSQVPGVDTASAQAAYFQVAYRFLSWLQPAYRIETVQSIDTQDTFFTIINARNGTNHVAALRFDLDDTNAITLEVVAHQPEDSAIEDHTEFRVDWAFLMF